VSLLFFSSFLFRFDDIPKWWQWYAYINPLRYAWGAQMINQFEGKRGPNGEIQLQGTEILEYYGLDGYSRWEMIGYVLLFAITFFFLTWAALQFKRLAKR
jgi:ATP-binding cassette, subfamily G (WHITE), member 2